ncbi:hypothetical protein A9Q99_25100 [Gammaproteobacteria bacterium 45_16_T64]|nr:hypothetical protein A9Q99_25100 [Gammaproteobacteria bacterium 45_16_T64]
MRIKNRRAVFFFPALSYDITQFALFPLNYAISAACHLQPKDSVWNEEGFESQKLTGSGKPLDQVQQEILQQQDVAYNEEDLVRLYDSLPAVSATDDLVGRAWQGKILRTNASVLDLAEWCIIRPLSYLGVKWGKRYRTQDKGDPLLMRWKDKVYAPIPMWGNVGMTDIKWRGVSTATMNYDHQPWKDYFRLLSNDDGTMVLLGVWTHKHIAGGWFTLTLDPDVVT